MPDSASVLVLKVPLSTMVVVVVVGFVSTIVHFLVGGIAHNVILGRARRLSDESRRNDERSSNQISFQGFLAGIFVRLGKGLTRIAPPQPPRWRWWNFRFRRGSN